MRSAVFSCIKRQSEIVSESFALAQSKASLEGGENSGVLVTEGD